MDFGKGPKNDTETITIRALDMLKQECPPMFGRTSVPRLFPGIISEKTLANLACRGEGPPFLKMARRVIYERESFIQWLEGELEQ